MHEKEFFYTDVFLVLLFRKPMFFCFLDAFFMVIFHIIHPNNVSYDNIC